MQKLRVALLRIQTVSWLLYLPTISTTATPIAFNRIKWTKPPFPIRTSKSQIPNSVAATSRKAIFQGEALLSQNDTTIWAFWQRIRLSDNLQIRILRISLTTREITNLASPKTSADHSRHLSWKICRRSKFRTWQHGNVDHFDRGSTGRICA